MKILYVTTIGLTTIFLKDLTRELIQKGHTVDIACNGSDFPADEFYHQFGCKVYQIDCSRSPLSLGNISAVKAIKEIVRENGYDIVHCHTPVAGVCARVACKGLRKRGVKVFYTAHGFHFFKGAPLKNWLIYYPIEKACAHWTDTLITINHEDYDLAKRKMKAQRIEYVPGVGINVDNFRNTVVDRAAKRKELGIPEDAFLLLSVGELNKNKNHQIIIRAIAQLEDPNIHYAIAGVGDERSYLRKLANSLGVADRVHLLGYRNDVAELDKSADVFCFPSFREGLGLAAIEAMACALPIVTSNVRGINDYSIDGVTGYKCDPNSVEQFADAIKRIAMESSRIFRKNNPDVAARYDVEAINAMIYQMYGN